MTTRPRVFISFDYDHDRNYANMLRAWAKNENIDFDIYDESVTVPVNSQNADYIKRRIRQKIKRASVTLCLIGENTWRSGWVNWEIETSANMGNALVAVFVVPKSKVQYIPRELRVRDHVVASRFSLDGIKRAIAKAVSGR